MTAQSAIYRTLVDAGIVDVGEVQTMPNKLTSYSDYLEARAQLLSALDRANAEIADAKRLCAVMNAYLAASAELDAHEREDRERMAQHKRTQ